MSTLNVGAIDYTSGVAIKSQAVNTQTGTTYTFVADDAGKAVTSDNASPVTFTIPPQSSVAWGDNTILKVVNYGAGALTVDGGSGVTVTNTATTIEQYQSAVAIRTGSDAWTLVPFAGGGVSNADFSNTATGTYTDGGGQSFKYVTFAASGTLTITQEGWADILVVGGGGGGVQRSANRCGGGGGCVRYGGFIVSVGSYTVTIGSGGAGSTTDARASAGGLTSIGSILQAGGGGGGHMQNNAIGAGVGNGGSGGAYQGGFFNANLAGGGAGSGSSGLSLDYTGSSVSYGAGGTSGLGGNGSASRTGNNGVVVVRVRT